MIAVPPVSTAVAVARRLHRTHVDDAAQLVDHERGEGFSFHVLGDNQQRSLGLGHLLEQRNQLWNAADLLLVHQHEGLIKHTLHRILIRHEVWREKSAVKLHSLDHLDDGVGGLALLDRDDAVLADLLETVGQQLADRLIVVRGDPGDVDDVIAFAHLDRTGHLFHRFDHSSNRFFDSTV